LVKALKASMPSLEGLDPELTAELEGLEGLNDESLRGIMRSRISDVQLAELEDLLDKNQAGTLRAEGRKRLSALQREADRLMLRKARAAVVLKFRGHRLPTLEEPCKQEEQRD